MPFERNLDANLEFKMTTYNSRTESKYRDIVKEHKEPELEDNSFVNEWFKKSDDGFDHLLYQGKHYKLKRPE